MSTSVQHVGVVTAGQISTVVSLVCFPCCWPAKQS